MRYIINLFFLLVACPLSAATLTLTNSTGVQVEFDFHAYSNEDIETVYISLEPGESIELEIPIWYTNGQINEYGTGQIVSFVEGDDAFHFWWTGSAFSLTAPVLRSDEASAFLAGFGLAALVRVFRAGIRWVKRAGDISGGAGE